MSTDLLKIRGIVKRFGGITAINSLDLDLPAGTVFGLMGPNGAGKSALLNVISGLYTADGGSITLDGRELTGLAPNAISRLGVARTFQNVRLFPGLTVRGQVVSGIHRLRRHSGWQSIFLTRGERSERKDCERRAEEILDWVGVTGVERFADTLSYGEQRRVEIARALASQPRLLLLDEPSAGMNHREASDLGDLTHRLREQGITVLLIEHNMRLISDYCDVAFVMNFGQRLAFGSPADCIADPAVQEAYFGRRSDAERVEAMRVLRRDRRG